MARETVATCDGSGCGTVIDLSEPITMPPVVLSQDGHLKLSIEAAKEGDDLCPECRRKEFVSAAVAMATHVGVRLKNEHKRGFLQRWLGIGR
jgi:hypothetical protein